MGSEGDKQVSFLGGIGWLGKSLATLLLVACASCSLPDLSSLPGSTPEAENLDAQALRSLVQSICRGGPYAEIDSLLIVRNGRLVVEEYFNGYARETLHTIQSVTKSFTSALIGIARASGDIESINDRVMSFFPGVVDPANLDDRRGAIRIRNLLTMTSGTDYHEGCPGSPHDVLNHLERG
jgi:CubicO group peptidase (beta-lactamase class C family)